MNKIKTNEKKMKKHQHQNLKELLEQGDKQCKKRINNKFSQKTLGELEDQREHEKSCKQD